MVQSFRQTRTWRNAPAPQGSKIVFKLNSFFVENTARLLRKASRLILCREVTVTKLQIHSVNKIQDFFMSKQEIRIVTTASYFSS
jgi:hypothetical protein